MGRKDCFRCSFGTSFQAKQWISLNPYGLVGVSLSLFIHLFSLYTMMETNIKSKSVIFHIIYVIFYLPFSMLAICSLLMTWLTDPGAVPIGARPLQINIQNFPDNGGGKQVQQSISSKRGIGRCENCNNNFKPDRAHHDSVTGRCIVKMDHFCPWVGNVVGLLNHKFFFYSFFIHFLVLYLLLLSLLLHIMNVAWMIMT